MLDVHLDTHSSLPHRQDIFCRIKRRVLHQRNHRGCRVTSDQPTTPPRGGVLRGYEFRILADDTDPANPTRLSMQVSFKRFLDIGKSIVRHLRFHPTHRHVQ